MAVTPYVLVSPKQAENTNTVQYTSTNVKTIIDSFTATNTSATAVTLTVYLVPSAGTAGASNTIISAQSIAAGECWRGFGLIGKQLNSGDTLNTLCSAATSLTIACNGRQITS